MSYAASYAATRGSPRRARRAHAGLGTVVLGIVIPSASGASGTGQQFDIPTMFGDYESDPLVVYMAKYHPIGLAAGPNATFSTAVRDAMVELGYGAQPLATLQETALHAAAAMADRVTAPILASGLDQTPAQVQATIAAAQLLQPVVAELAAMPKPLQKLAFPPGMAACVKSGGTYHADGKCVVPLKFPPGMAACVTGGGKWAGGRCTLPASTRAAPMPAAAPVPASSDMVYYVGAAVVVLGLGAYVLTRKP